jgi:hypothetical protein
LAPLPDGQQLLTTRSSPPGAAATAPTPCAGHLDRYPTGRDNALPLERRIEIVEAKIAELVGLGASVEHRTRHDDPQDPVYYF